MSGVSEAAKAKAAEICAPWRLPEVRDNVAAFVQQVSDAAKEVAAHFTYGDESERMGKLLAPFILPEPVDPLAEAYRETFAFDNTAEDHCQRIREALAKRGLEIREVKP